MTDLSSIAINNDMIERGARLVENRKALGFKAVEVYEQLNIAQTTYKNYELGIRDIPSNILMGLSKLGFDVNYILFGQESGDRAGKLNSHTQQNSELAEWLSRQPETDRYQINRIINIHLSTLGKAILYTMPEDLNNWLKNQPKETIDCIKQLTKDAEDTIKNPEQHAEWQSSTGLDKDINDWLIKQPIEAKGKINSLLRFAISHFF